MQAIGFNIKLPHFTNHKLPVTKQSILQVQSLFKLPFCRQIDASSQRGGAGEHEQHPSQIGLLDQLPLVGCQARVMVRHTVRDRVLEDRAHTGCLDREQV